MRLENFSTIIYPSIQVYTFFSSFFSLFAVIKIRGYLSSSKCQISSTLWHKFHRDHSVIDSIFSLLCLIGKKNKIKVRYIHTQKNLERERAEKGHDLTSCSQLVRAVTISNDMVWTMIAQVIPSQSPCIYGNTFCYNYTRMTQFWRLIGASNWGNKG